MGDLLKGRSSIGRAPVSKTGGCEFKSHRPCHTLFGLESERCGWLCFPMGAKLRMEANVGSLPASKKWSLGSLGKARGRRGLRRPDVKRKSNFEERLL